MIEAALALLEKSRQEEGEEFPAVYSEIEQKYKSRLGSLSGPDGQEVMANRHAYARYLQLSRSLLGAERQTALQLREEGRINDEVLRKVEHELDLTETRLSLIP